MLQHKTVKSDLIRGLSCFDSGIILDGEEDRYNSAIEQLTSHFTSHGSITASDKSKAISQYMALVVKFRSSQIDWTVDWFRILSGHYELHCRPELHQVFKNVCLCLPPMAKIPVRFEVPIPELGTDEEICRSCVTSIQVSYATVPNVSSLFRDPRSINRVLRLLGKVKDLLSDRKFSVWNFLKGSWFRRTKLQTKFENSYKSVVARREKVQLADDSDVPSASRSSSNTSSPTSQALTGKVTLSLPRCVNERKDDKRSMGKIEKIKKN